MYPTKEEILEAVKYTKPTLHLRLLDTWKKTFYTKMWKSSNASYKFKALIILIEKLTNNENIKVQLGKEYSYSPTLKILTLGEIPSIISTLHEIGHVILGNEEINACRFSVALFKTVFPNEYSKLEWNGHMLRRKIN